MGEQTPNLARGLACSQIFFAEIRVVKCFLVVVCLSNLLGEGSSNSEFRSHCWKNLSMFSNYHGPTFFPLLSGKVTLNVFRIP